MKKRMRRLAAVGLVTVMTGSMLLEMCIRDRWYSESTLLKEESYEISDSVGGR